MISCAYVPIVIVPHDVSGMSDIEALILIPLFTVISILLMKFFIWYIRR